MDKKVCTGTGYDIDYCREEKMGCDGCNHYECTQNSTSTRKKRIIKNANLEWNVLYKDFNSKKIKNYNILGGSFSEDLAKNIKKYKIENKEQLKEYLKRDFMYHYWSKYEYEIAVGGLNASFPDEFEKIDIWRQIEMNFDRIIDYIIDKMRLF